MKKILLVMVFLILVVVAVAIPVGVHMANNTTDADKPPVVDESDMPDMTINNMLIPETINPEVDTTGLETEPESPETDVILETTGTEISKESEPEDTIAVPVVTTAPDPALPELPTPVATEPVIIEPVVTEPVIVEPGITTPIIPFETDPPAPVVTEPPAPVETVAPETEITITPVVTPSKPTPVVKQMADVKTGISWDGVSPIIYTYPDGTTGTEIRVGATYELVPGMSNTVNEVHMPDWKPDSKDYDTCTYCGKIMGDGSGGTCIRYWLGDDHTCGNCGVVIPQSTCHTCNN